ncbi:response regulator, partial [Bacillus thuringiensis]|uniref:response regulator n=1 Tax=Bacillus thuringiensis TaxID=1428 RepID=UPI0021B267A0
MHLEKEGYHVLKPPDAQDPLHIIQTNPIDFLVLDIMIPKMDGYQVTPQIPPKHHIPIIFLTPKTSDFHNLTPLLLPPHHYITNP